MFVATPSAVVPRVRWSWLWSSRDDVTWNLLPFWISAVVAALLFFGARHLGGTDSNLIWNYAVGGHQIHVLAIVMYLYGPLVDAPHLWATIARTYVDRDEWAARRRLFLWSLAWFLIGPVFLLLPYALRAVVPTAPAGLENAAWLVWSHFFMFYAIYHINKQHWGFVSLYKRKNGDLANPVENRIDVWFFNAAIWLPYVAMLTAPWFMDFDGKPMIGTRLPVAGTTLGALLHGFCHVAFVAACISYIAFQVDQWRKGVTRDGPKLLYLGTVVSLYYVAFAVHPLLATYWVLITGVGHCAQYHRVVWGYGYAKYAGKSGSERRTPSAIFENVWIYVGLGLAFGLITMQGPGNGIFKRVVASTLEIGLFRHAFGFLDRDEGLSLGIKMAAAFIGGVRLHHFYVDSKIWRVSKSAALARNLNV